MPILIKTFHGSANQVSSRLYIKDLIPERPDNMSSLMAALRETEAFVSSVIDVMRVETVEVSTKTLTIKTYKSRHNLRDQMQKGR